MNKGKGFVDLVAGQQWGSEYKGAGVIIATRYTKYDLLISVNTSNSGHSTFAPDGTPLVARFLPTACVHNPTAKIIIGSGTNIDAKTLKKEIELFEKAGVKVKDRLLIHQVAGELLQSDIKAEQKAKIDKRIGSTAHGVGEALVNRVRRTAPLFIDNHKKEYTFISNLDYMKLVNSSKTLLEGSQGYLLSINSEFYPFVTSRITTTAGYLSFANIRPQLLRNVYGVFRTFPIRVANRDLDKPLDKEGNYSSKEEFIGTSGSMNGLELSWEQMQKISGYKKLTEITTVTKLKRRIAEISPRLVEEAMLENGVTHPILTFINYINKDDESKKSTDELSEKSRIWIRNLEGHTGVRFYALSTDPKTVFIK